MAVKQQAEVTLTDYSDASSIVCWYKISTSATLPSAPTTTQTSQTVSGWQKTEPTITSDADAAKYVYSCWQTNWGDGSCEWGDVSMSASFEAAKRAWNKASAAQTAADEAQASANASIVSKSQNDGSRSITTVDAAELPLLTLDPVYGECVQSGTPTPSAPAYIRAVRHRNLLKGDNKLSSAAGEYGWTNNMGSSPVLEVVEKDGFECIHLQASVTDKYIPSIATRHRINLEWGCTYTVVCYVMFDKEVVVAANAPLYYHMGSVATTDEFDTAINGKGGGVSLSLVSPAANTTVPANTWTRIEARVTTAASAPNASYKIPVFRPFLYGSIRTTSETVTMNTWMHSYMFECSTLAHDYIPYGKIGVSAKGLNLFDVGTFDATKIGHTLNADGTITGPATDNRAWGYDSSEFKFSLPAGTYTLAMEVLAAGNDTSAKAALYNSSNTLLKEFTRNDVNSVGVKTVSPFTLSSETKIGLMAKVYGSFVRFWILEGSYTASNVPAYSTFIDSVSYIDLKGNGVYGLDSTFRDVLRVGTDGRVALEKRTVKCKGSDFTVTQYTNATNAWGLNLIHKSGNAAMGIWSGAKSGGPIPLSSILLGTNTSPWSGESSTINHISGTTGTYPNNIYCCVSKSDYATIADFNTALAGALANSEFVFGLDPKKWYTVDLGYVDLPTVNDGSIVNVEAEVQPVIGGSWWTERGYQAGRAHVDATRVVASQKPYIVGTQTAATYDWTGDCPELSVLREGQQITYVLPYSVGGTAISAAYTTISSGASTNTTGAALTLTLADGSSTGQVPIWYGNGMGRVTSHYAYGSVITMTYREDIVMGGTYHIDNGWFIDAEYNSDTVYSRSISGGFYTGANGVLSYGLMMKDSNGRWTAIVNNKYSNSTQDKTCYTGGLELGEVLYCSTWYSNGRVATNNTSVSGDLWASYIFDFRFCTNISANSTAGKALTVRQPVYLVGTISNSDGMFHLDTTQWWTQTANDSTKVYIYLGTAYSWYQLSMVDSKPVYTWDGTKLVPLDLTTVVKSQDIYIQASSVSDAPTVPSAWVEESGESISYGTQGDASTITCAWTLKHPTYNRDRPVTFVATQSKRLDGTVTCSNPLPDDTDTVIDGGRIITNSIQAHSLEANCLKLSNFSSEVTDKFGSYDQAVGDVGTLSGNVETLSNKVATFEAVERMVSSHDGQLTTIMNSLKFREGELELKTQSGSDSTSVALTSTKLAFRSGNSEVASISNEKLDIQNAEVHGTLAFGGFAFIPRSNGNLSLKWIGA